jgi:spore coat protein CotH
LELCFLKGTTMRSRVWILAFFLIFLIVSSANAQTSDDFFSPNELHEIRLYIHPVDWAKLRENYLDNTYYDCTLVWRSQQYEVASEYIQVRSRGLGSRSKDKPGLRLDFDPFSDRPQRFLGLKSCVLDNLVQDPSMLRERLSMQLFERLGLPVSRETNTRLYVNDQYLGLYTIVESVDKDFLKRNFGENDGYLYEYQWMYPYYFTWLGEDLSRYEELFDPKTHEKDSKTALYGPIEAMIRAINQSGQENLESSMGGYLDLRMFVTLVAVESFLAEADGILGYAGMNNFYLYRFEGKDLFQFIPWDKDTSMSSITSSIWERVNENELMRQALQIPELRGLFLEVLLTCADVAGGPEGWLEGEIEREYQQIRDAALADPHKPYSNDDFENAVNFLRQFARERSANVWSEVVANLPSSQGGGDFE